MAHVKSLLLTLTITLAAGCGGGETTGVDTPQPSNSDDEAPSRVCSLLTVEQVAGVLPGHDGGKDKDASEASLLKDVTLEHCQYTFVKEMDLRFLDVFIWTATSDAGVEAMPSQLKRCPDADCRKLDMGDLSFVANWSDSPHVVVNKDRQVLEVSMTGEGAAASSDALVALTRSAAAKLWP